MLRYLPKISYSFKKIAIRYILKQSFSAIYCSHQKRNQVSGRDATEAHEMCDIMQMFFFFFTVCSCKKHDVRRTDDAGPLVRNASQYGGVSRLHRCTAAHVKKLNKREI